MTHRIARSLLWVAIVCLALASAQVLAARVSAQPRNGYQRVNFTFDHPAQLKLDNKGNTLVLHFSTPLQQSADTIQSAMGNTVKSATLSPDGKNLTLALTKPMRTRHFVSGNTVGVDFITPSDNTPNETQMAKAPEQEAPESLDADTPEPMLTTKKTPAPAKPAKKEIAAKAPTPVAAPIKIAAKEVKPATPEPKAEEILTTKKPVPAPAAEEAKPEPKPAPKIVTAPVPQPAPAAPVKPTEAAPPTIPVGPFAVTVRNTSTQNILSFPYRERTAAAVFERGNSIWIVFARPSNFNVAQLKTILPKTVTNAVQYDMAGNSVLQLTTNGTIHAAAENVKGSYQWNVALAAARVEPANAISISADNDSGKTHLLFGAFDVAPALRFYDPQAGDLLMVIPSYENKHGVQKGRSFPELSVLASNQGIAITSARDDLNTNSSRAGLAIEGADSLAISQNLAIIGSNNTPISGLSSGVLLPYDAWYIPTNQFSNTLIEREQELTHATKDSRADIMLSLATLYLSRGMGAEALGYLDLLHANEPEFFKTHKLALLTAASHALENHMDAALVALSVPELADIKEADLWREYVGLFARKPNEVQQAVQNVAAPTFAAPSLADDYEDVSDAPADPAATPAPTPTAPVMRFLKYNRAFIRFYPPKIRQMLTSGAANAYLANGLEEKALAAYDTLNRDEILGHLKPQAEYALALAAAKQKKPEQTREILTRLATQENDPRSKARARATLAMMDYKSGKKTAMETAEALEQARAGWRGDAVEVDILKTLAGLYKDAKEYGEALRVLKTLTDEFPGESDYLTSSGELSDYFEDLYLNGVADEMSPLKALALFYEFKDLTPIGEKGDLIIQRLADRLAAIDLIDRATQLLENQISFRLSGETRSRVGARLGLLYLFNHQPQEALKVLEVTNYGNNPPDLQRQRLQLTAQALSALDRHADALNIIAGDYSDAGNLLRLDILWAAQDWPNVVTTAEDILSKRADLTATLNATETAVLLKLALGYSFQGDYNQLRYLRDYYSGLIPDSAYKQIFDFITNDTNPLDREDSAMLTEQISRTESFLSTFKEKIANGKLSEAVK